MAVLVAMEVEQAVLVAMEAAWAVARESVEDTVEPVATAEVVRVPEMATAEVTFLKFLAEKNENRQINM